MGRDIASVRRALVALALPLAIAFAALAGYATLSCRALEPFSWQWSLLLAYPTATLGACGGMV
jgi:hypothetical protein